MKFTVFVVPGDSAEYEAGTMPEQDEIAVMMAFNEELVNAGVMLDGDGYHPTSKAVRVSWANGKPSLTDGPFAEMREVIGGYWIWEVGTREEALEWAQRCPMRDGDTLILRQHFAPEDFGDALGPDERAAWERMENRNGAKQG